MIEGNILKMGDVELEIDPSSMFKTDEIIKRLDPVQLQRLGSAYAVVVGPGHPRSALLTMVRSHVQNEWWQMSKGRVPDMVQKNHDKRAEQISKAASAGEAGGEAKEAKKREPKTPEVFRLLDLDEAQTTEIGKIRGQRQITLEYLKKADPKNKGVTAAQVAEAIAAAGVPYPSKAPVPDSVRYHLKGLQTLGFVEEVQAQA